MFPLILQLSNEKHLGLGFSEDALPDAKWMALLLKNFKKEQYNNFLGSEEDEITQKFLEEPLFLNPL